MKNKFKQKKVEYADLNFRILKMSLKANIKEEIWVFDVFCHFFTWIVKTKNKNFKIFPTTQLSID